MLFEKLSEDEKNMMNCYINNFAITSNDTERTASLEYLMRFWDSAKSEYLYRMLGNNFMYTKQIAVHKDQTELEIEVDDKLFRSRKFDKFIDDYNDYIYNIRPNDYYEYYNLDDHHEHNPSIDAARAYYGMSSLTDVKTLATNIYEHNTFTFISPKTGKPVVIQKGCKAIKAIGKICDEAGIEGFEEFRLAHSLCLNEKLLKGTLTLSIHPFDYMTMSDNHSDWTSCMSWIEDGEYKRGTVEMMNSPMVVVAYLTSETEKLHIDNNYEWNSKKWRELFIVTPATISGIKGYPYWNTDLEREVIMILRELAQTNLGWGPYNSEPISFKANEILRCEEFNKDVYLRFYTDAMYNDFYLTHQAIISHNCPLNVDINYSGKSMCMACGCTDTDFDYEGSLCCQNCNHTDSCCNCGDNYNSDELIEVDGELYCQYCYEDLPCCDLCEDRHPEYNLTEVYIADANIIYKNKYLYLCEDCLCQYSKYINYYDTEYRSYAYIDISTASRDMLKTLGYNDADEFRTSVDEFDEIITMKPLKNSEV